MEYYAGVGVMGLCLAEKAQSVICCEANPQAERCFTLSKERLDPEIAQKITYHTAKAEKMAHLIDAADTILIDPPRKGLESALLKVLQSQKKPKRLIYVSCGWESFQRDANALLDASWQLERAEGYLLFPGSDHIELLVQFRLK